MATHSLFVKKALGLKCGVGIKYLTMGDIVSLVAVGKASHFPKWEHRVGRLIQLRRARENRVAREKLRDQAETICILCGNPT